MNMKGRVWEWAFLLAGCSIYSACVGMSLCWAISMALFILAFLLGPHFLPHSSWFVPLNLLGHVLAIAVVGWAQWYARRWFAHAQINSSRGAVKRRAP
jgi:hypothetical protein